MQEQIKDSCAPLATLALAFATVSHAGCLGPARAAFWRTVSDFWAPWASLDRLGRSLGAGSLKHSAKAGLGAARGRESLKHFAESGLGTRLLQLSHASGRRAAGPGEPDLKEKFGARIPFASLY